MHLDSAVNVEPEGVKGLQRAGNQCTKRDDEPPCHNHDDAVHLHARQKGVMCPDVPSPGLSC
jgi:hypothetical protein